MAKSGESKVYTTFDGRGITDIDALLRDPKVQETIRKLSRNRDRGSRKGYITILSYRKPE
jgi:hypothetical protein